MVDGSRVQWVGITMGSVLAEVSRVNVREADATTFRAIDRDYAADGQHVFYRGRLLAGEYPTAFKTLPDRFAIGSLRVYYDGQVLPGANPATWRIIEGTALYSTDGVYAFTGAARLEGADPATFKVYDLNKSLASDGRNFYYGNIREGGIEDCGPPVRLDLTLTRVPYFCSLFGVADPP